MNIGEKIKAIRTAKFITQRELAGDTITRNMLSRIENGAALPSLPTLRYLAERLNVPVGYLLSDGDATETFYRKCANYGNIMQAYQSGEWEICRSLCEACHGDDTDHEILFLLAESNVRLGETAFNEGRLHPAKRLFEEGVEYALKTRISTEALCCGVMPYLRFMRDISPTLHSDLPETQPAERYECQCDFCRFERLYAAQTDMAVGTYPFRNATYGCYLAGLTLMRRGEYTAAEALLFGACEDETLPKPVLYRVLTDTEICCREADDYKNAYEVSHAKIQLFEKMLAEE